jgi:hypothetical protein
MQRKVLSIFIVILILTLGLNGPAWAQDSTPAGADAVAGSAFTYQGQLKNASGPVTASCNFQLGLWDALTGGTQVGSTLTQTGVPVSEGLFTVQLDFGANAFNGSARWLEIAVSCPADGGAYNTLAPRQPLTAAPYANYALTAGAADSAGYATTAGSADTLDGLHASAFQQHYQNLVVVAKSGGDFSTITDALNSITTNSAANPFTIYVAPGVYNERVTMKPYIDIEGAGETATKITYTGSFYSSSATLYAVNNAELRFITVENTGGDSCAVAIHDTYTNMRMTHVTAIATGAENNFAVYMINSSMKMTNMTITAHGLTGYNYGIYISSGSPTLTDIRVTVTGGDYNYAIDNSSAATMTDVTANASGGTIYNIGVYNGYGYEGSITMMNVTATGSGGLYAYGVENYDSSPTMNNVTATASGEGYTYGVYNAGTSTSVMINVIASGSGGNMNYGVFNTGFSCSPTLNYVTADASGGTESYGIYNNYAPITMTNVIATASDATYQDAGVYNYGSASRMTNVTASASNGTGANIGVYNSVYYSGSAKPMMNVTASASGGNYSYGVYNYSSTPAMTNVAATGSGGTTNYGVFNTNSAPIMNNVTATATGGTNAYGMWNSISSPTIQNSVIGASGGSLNDGIHNYATSGSYTVTINNSQITGSTSTIYQVDTYYTTQLGASQVIGGGVFGGTHTCVASFNSSYTLLDSITCH